MNLRTILAALALIALCLCASAKSDPESVHVQVVLFSGDTITGYLRNDLKTGVKNFFSKSGSIQQYINVGEEPKGGETQRLSASQVKEYRYLQTTESDPEGAVVVSERINAPVMFKPNASVRGFARELDRRDNGSIIRWQVWESYGHQGSQRRLVPVVGVKFRGSKAAYIIVHNGGFTSALLMNYLKKASPEFREVLNQYYQKGKDAKAHRKELVDNPSTILLLYDEFLKTHPALDDEEEEPALGEAPVEEAPESPAE